MGVVTVACLSACTVERQQPKLVGQDIRLTIIHTSDIHSRLFPYNFVPNSFDQDYGLLPANAPFGGVARISTLAKRIRATSNRSLWLDSGDAFQGAIASAEGAAALADQPNYLDMDRTHALLVDERVVH